MDIDSKTNHFDKLVIDVSNLYKIFPVTKKFNAKPNYIPCMSNTFYKLYRNQLFPLKIRRYAYRGFRQIHIDLTWFNLFKEYWGNILSGRPLWSVVDLFYLKNIYRSSFQNLEVQDTDNPHVHLDAWQAPEMLYSLLHYVTKESVTDFIHIIDHIKHFIGNINNCQLLEYGCSLAPISYSLYTFGKIYPKRIYIADIQALPFHYGAYRFRNTSNVIPILLQPDNNFQLQLQQQIDIIFCIEVFEHLNDPLTTVEIFNNTLRTNGFLFYDFIESDGEGLDTLRAKTQRDLVIEFIKDNFQIIFENEKTGLTIAQKK